MDAVPGARRAPELGTLLTLAWPVVLSRSAQAVIGFCDALMTAPLGEHALAAATTGSLNTTALLILPIIIVATREAIRTVPDAQREAAAGST